MSESSLLIELDVLLGNAHVLPACCSCSRDSRFEARPITSLAEAPRWTVERCVEGVDDGPSTVWSNWNVRETMPDPLQPLSW